MPSVRFLCPGCAAKIRMRDAYAGRQVQCPRCRAAMRIPRPLDNPQVIEDGPPRWHKDAVWRAVSVSARIISWPARCCCCFRPTEMNVRVTAFRTKGVRVIRYEEYSWGVPCCPECIRHQDAYGRHCDAREALDALEFEPPQPMAWMSFMTGGISFLVLELFAALCFFQPLLGAPLAILLASCGLAALLFFLGNGWVVAARDVAAVRDVEREYDRREAGLQADLRDTEAAIKVCRECVSFGLAARYVGWSGTVHTFEFCNDQFRLGFEEANRGKIVL